MKRMSSSSGHASSLLNHTGNIFLVLLLLYAWADPLHAQSSTTQQVAVSEGWNMVSFHVEPSSTRLEDIFAGHLNDILIVQDDDGLAFIPSLGIDEIGNWESTKGYLLFAWSSFMLDVEGARLSTNPQPVEIASGWSLIPFFSARPMAVEEALDSLGDNLITVNSFMGGMYYPADGVVTLDSLHPGQGYQVFLSDASVLQYPGGDTPATDTTKVLTLPDALALEGLPVGHVVEVLGYHEPDDGGGGVFQVTDGAERTDGGIAFVFDEDLSAELVYSAGRLGSVTQLPHTDIAWRSVYTRYGSEDHQVIAVQYMDGHINRGTPPVGWLNTKEGWIGNTEAIFPRLGTSHDVFYRRATSNRRLVRQGVSNAVNVAWWGAQEADPNDPRDATTAINWAITRAYQMIEWEGFEEAYVDVDRWYYKLFQTFMPSNVVLRGVGDTLTTYTGETHNGQTITVNIKGGFRVPPGLALWQILSTETFDHTHPYERFDLFEEHRGKTGFRNAEGATRIRFEHFEFDGNLSNNQQVIDNFDDYTGAQNYFQNSGGWAGYQVQDLHGNATPSYADEMPLELYQSAFRNVGGNAIAGGSRSDHVMDIESSLVGESLRNHLLYGMGGTVNNLIVRGETHTAWGGILKTGNFSGGSRPSRLNSKYQPTYTNIVFQNLVRSNVFNWGAVFEMERAHVTLDGFAVDYRESGTGSRVAEALEHGNQIRNGKIHISETTTSTLFRPSFQHRWPLSYEDWETTLIENIDIIDHGGGAVLVHIWGSRSTNLRFRNVTVTPGEGVTGAAAAAAFGVSDMANITQVKELMPGPMRMDFENVQYLRPAANGIMVTNSGGNEEAWHAPIDVFVGGSTFRHNSGSIFHQLKAGAGHRRAVRLYMHDTTFDMTEEHDLFGINSVIRLRNAQTTDGRFSDQSGVFVSGESDEGNSFVDIPTSLLSNIAEHELTLTDAPTGVSIESSEQVSTPPNPTLRVNLSGAIQTGETVTIAWEARVTPLADYSPTGVFITRPLDDITINAIEEVDLRSVAASHEDRTVVEYTATSSDESVVQVQMLPRNHNYDHDMENTQHIELNYDTRLELNPQSPGTATIAVTAYINGVGMAQTTFEVTVE